MPLAEYINESATTYHAFVTFLFGVLLAGYLISGVSIRQDLISVYLLVIFTALLLLPMIQEMTLLGLKFKSEKRQ